MAAKDKMVELKRAKGKVKKTNEVSLQFASHVKEGQE